MRIEHNLLARITLYINNYCEGEELSQKLFSETFGSVMGKHYHTKWHSTYQRDLLKMIGYFGINSADGQKFCDMLRRQVAIYEHRVGRTDKPSSDLKISEETGEVVDIFLKPETEPYNRKRKELIEQAGMSESEAETRLLTTPIQLELFYSPHQGLFAVESEPLDCIEVYNPYTGEEIPNYNLNN